MPSWGNNDNSANAPLWAAHSVNLRGTSGNISSLFDNTTPNSFAVNTSGGGQRFANTTIGLFALDANETQVQDASATGGYIAHSGWNLVTTGTGGRSGRVTIETLVALANVIGDSDGQLYPNVAFTLALSGNQTVNSNTSFANNATFTVTPTITAGNTAAVLSYQWQYNNATGTYGWANIPANTTTIHFSGATSPTLYAIPGTTANNTNVFRVVVSDAVDGVSVTSANVSISIPN